MRYQLYKTLHLGIAISALIIFANELPAQTFSWAKQFGGTNSTTSTPIGNIQIDPFGNMYFPVSGTATIDVDPGPNVVSTTGGLVKLDPSGNFLWVKQIPIISAIDASGNLYCTGSFSGTKDFDPGAGIVNLTSFGYDDIYILKFDQNGNLIWAKQVGGNFVERSGGLVLSSNNIYVFGGFGYGGNVSPVNSCDFDPNPSASYNLTNIGSWDGFILSLDLDGQFNAVSQKGTPASETTTAVGCDKGGNILYQLTDTVMRLQKDDPNLNLIWSVGLFNVGMNIAPITLDAEGNILISGGYMGTSDFDPGPGVAKVPSVTISGSVVQAPFVEKFDANGNFMWVRTIQANGFANGVISDATGNVYTVGYFNNSGNVDFDPGPGTYAFKVSALACYVQKLTPSGNFVWATKVGGEVKTETLGRAIIIKNSGEIFTTLQFKGTIDVDPGSARLNMTPVGTKDVLLHKMVQPVNAAQKSPDIVVSESNSLKVIQAYPNPNYGSFYINVPATGEHSALEIFSLSGQLILKRSFNGKYDQRLFINKEIRNSGVYILRVKGNAARYQTRVTVQ